MGANFCVTACRSFIGPIKAFIDTDWFDTACKRFARTRCTAKNHITPHQQQPVAQVWGSVRGGRNLPKRLLADPIHGPDTATTR